jgi:hypothetical protein
MNSTNFSNLVHSISYNLWENNLDIGQVSNLTIEEISNRKYSYVAKCLLSGTQTNSRVYVKFYKNGKNVTPDLLAQQVEREYQTILHYYNEFKKSDCFNIVKPLFTIPEKFILVTEEVAGENLYKIIGCENIFLSSGEKFKKISNSLFQVGSWLKYFHSLEEPFPTNYTIDELIEYIKVRLQILNEDKRRQFPENFSGEILTFIKKNEAAISVNELRIHSSHSDFNLGNIVVDGNRVTVLDFTKIKQDSFLVDVSRIYHQLFLITFKPQYRVKLIREFQRALLKGFGVEHADHFMLFRFFLIRHTLTHLVGITRFWQVNFKERLYNRWVLHKELSYLKYLVRNTNSVT